MSAEVILAVVLFFCSIILGLLIIILARAIVYIIPMLNGPVFVPSSTEAIETMIKLAELKKADRIVDLGSGDGKVVIELAKRGFSAEGYEINPLLVRRSMQQIEKLNLQNKAKITHKSFWEADLSKYDVIMLYGTTYIMPKLEKKAQRELKRGGRVISNYFTFPNWKPKHSKDEIYVYVK